MERRRKAAADESRKQLMGNNPWKAAIAVKEYIKVTKGSIDHWCPDHIEEAEGMIRSMKEEIRLEANNKITEANGMRLPRKNKPNKCFLQIREVQIVIKVRMESSSYTHLTMPTIHSA